MSSISWLMTSCVSVRKIASFPPRIGNLPNCSAIRTVDASLGPRSGRTILGSPRNRRPSASILREMSPIRLRRRYGSRSVPNIRYNTNPTHGKKNINNSHDMAALRLATDRHDGQHDQPYQPFADIVCQIPGHGCVGRLAASASTASAGSDRRGQHRHGGGSRRVIGRHRRGGGDR